MTKEALSYIPGANAEEVKIDYDNFRQYQCNANQNGKIHGSLVPSDWSTSLKFFYDIGLLEHQVDPKTLYTNEFFEGPNPVSTWKCPT